MNGSNYIQVAEPTAILIKSGLRQALFGGIIQEKASWKFAKTLITFYPEFVWWRPDGAA